MANGQGLDRTLGITSDVSDGTFVAVIKFSYTDEELAEIGISEANLRIYRWDDDTQTWVVEGNNDQGVASPPTPATASHIGRYGVDTTNNFAWAIVDHLSIFGGGVVEEEAEPEPDGDDDEHEPLFGIAGCFIATACFGTPMAEEVKVLNQFRDECLLTNPVGTIFVETYYKVSPPVADFIRQHPILKSAVRMILEPMVWLAREFEN
jgi:hypothetical protein